MLLRIHRVPIRGLRFVSVIAPSILLKSESDADVFRFRFRRIRRRVDSGGARRVRTADPRLAKPMLSQLSYGPFSIVVGLDGLEPSTSPLSGVRSNHLSYRPVLGFAGSVIEEGTCTRGLL